MIILNVFGLFVCLFEQTKFGRGMLELHLHRMMLKVCWMMLNDAETLTQYNDCYSKDTSGLTWIIQEGLKIK